MRRRWLMLLLRGRIMIVIAGELRRKMVQPPRHAQWERERERREKRCARDVDPVPKGSRSLNIGDGGGDNGDECCDADLPEKCCPTANFWPNNHRLARQVRAPCRLPTPSTLIVFHCIGWVSPDLNLLRMVRVMVVARGTLRLLSRIIPTSVRRPTMADCVALIEKSMPAVTLCAPVHPRPLSVARGL